MGKYPHIKTVRLTDEMQAKLEAKIKKLNEDALSEITEADIMREALRILLEMKEV